MEKIGVVGLGIMGAGIVEVFAKANFSVVGMAESDAAVELGQSNLAKSLNRAVSREKITSEQAADITARVSWGTDFALLKDCDLVVEAAPEIMSLKAKIFAELDSHVKASAILASNTSSLSVTEISQATNRRSRVVGLHFFNPAPVQKFVEVISTDHSDSDVISTVVELAKALGKEPAQIGDQPGFIVNKLLLRYLNHAVRLIDGGLSTRDTIDAAMRELAHFPMGPLELLDLVGLDTSVEVLNTIYDDTGLDTDGPASGLTARVNIGDFGRKSGKGFYSYEQPHVAATSDDDMAKSRVYVELLNAYLDSAREMRDSGYATESDINLGMKLGCGLPEGPFETIARIGSDRLPVN